MQDGEEREEGKGYGCRLGNKENIATVEQINEGARAHLLKGKTRRSQPVVQVRVQAASTEEAARTELAIDRLLVELVRQERAAGDRGNGQ